MLWLLKKKNQYMNKYIDTKDVIFTQINPQTQETSQLMSHVLEEDIHSYSHKCINWSAQKYKTKKSSICSENHILQICSVTPVVFMNRSFQTLVLRWRCWCRCENSYPAEEEQSDININDRRSHESLIRICADVKVQEGPNVTHH